MDLAQSTKVVPGQMVTPDFGKFAESFKNVSEQQKLNLANQQSLIGLEQAQQGILANKAVSQAIKNNTNEAGDLDVPTIISQLAKDPNASLNLPELATKLLSLKGQQFTTDTAKLSNLATKNTLAGQRLGPLVAMINEGKPVTRDQLVNEFVHLNRIGVFTPQEAANHMATLPPKTGNAEKDQESLNNWITNEHRATLNNETLFGKLLPQQQYVGTGGGTQILNVKPLTGQTAPAGFIQGQLPPGTQLVAQEGDGTGLPAGTKYIMNQSGTPTIIPQGGMNAIPQGGMNPVQQGQPSKPLVTNLAPITENTNAKGMEIVTQAREKAAGIPTLRFNAGKIIEYAEKASTGTGGALLNDLKGNFAGLPFTGNTVTDFNLLGHNLAMQNAVLAKTPGINASDAGQKLAGEISGTTSWDKKSIIEATRTNRMMGEINDLFNQGVQKYAKSPEKAIEFQNKWNSVLDLDTIRLYDAAINKKTDPKAFASVVDNLGGKESKRFVEAAKHIDKINELITKGQ
jgi:hypothetical protein